EALRAMLAAHDINWLQWRWARRRPIVLHPGTLYSQINHPDFFGYVESELVRQFGARRVEAGGLQVETTVDPGLQMAARRAIAAYLPKPTDPGAALVAIDSHTGAIKAMVSYLPGGRKLQFNLAALMASRRRRQSGCWITRGAQAVNPLEMTDAYATFASRGVHHPPQALALVRGPRGEVLGRLDPHGARAIPQSTADQVTYALQHVIMNGTGTAATLSRPAAGKPGPAENFQAAWICG